MTSQEQVIAEMKHAMRVTLRRNASNYIAAGVPESELQTPSDWCAMRCELERWVRILERAGNGMIWRMVTRANRPRVWKPDYFGAPRCACGSRNTRRIGTSALLRQCQECGRSYIYELKQGVFEPRPLEIEEVLEAATEEGYHHETRKP